jgi:hypothetical protein
MSLNEIKKSLSLPQCKKKSAFFYDGEEFGGIVENFRFLSQNLDEVSKSSPFCVLCTYNGTTCNHDIFPTAEFTLIFPSSLSLADLSSLRFV